MQNGLFPDTCLTCIDRRVRLSVANGGVMGGGAREGKHGLEFWEHDPSDPANPAKRLMLHGKLYEAHVSDWHIIMGYDFMVSD